MAISLYDITIPSYLQTLGAVTQVLEKASGYCKQQDINLDEVVEARLHPDMLPLRFQIISVVHHSLGAAKGIVAGVCGVPGATHELNYQELQSLVQQAHDELTGYTRETMDACAGKDVVFKIGDQSLPFTAENYALSFALPNFYFHAATAYDILRVQGVPLGKRDFLGQLRMKAR